MKIFTVVSLLFVSLSVLAAGGGDKAHYNFFPRKEANKALAERPQAVELLEPKALSQVTGGQVTLKWQPVEKADSYRLQVATDPNFKWLVTQQDSMKETSFNLTGLEAGKHYFWRVYAWKAGNEPGHMSSFSNFSSFEVK